MPDKKPNRPEHSPEGYEWLPDAFARDVKPHGSEARESVRRAFTEGNRDTLLRTLIGERHPIPNRMWDKEPVVQKVYQRFEDGWLRMRLKLWTGPYVEGWIFVRQGALRKILDEGEAAPKRRDTVAAETECRNWLAALMKAGPPKKPKIEYQSEAKENFGVGTNAFNRAWQAANREAKNSTWRKPGPKTNS